MTDITSYRYGNLRLESAVPLGLDHIEMLIAAIRGPADKPVSRLGGRASVSRLGLAGVGAVIVKNYRRGGLIRRVLKDRYLYNPRPRCQREFEILDQVRRIGITVPRPLVRAFTAGVLYRCWLVIEAVDSWGSLADISRSDPKEAIRHARQAADQIRVLIRHRMLHVDLHPGNILAGIDGLTYLIDFDRARRYRLGKSNLCSRYRRRWQRAVVKHDLPGFLIDEFDAGLANPTYPQ